MSKERTEKDENLDEAYCQSIGKSIGEILRFSMDEEFRKRTFNILGVSSSQETETEITKKLMSMVQNKTKSKHKVKNNAVLEVTDKMKEDFSQGKIMNSSTSTTTECNVETLIPTFSKRNWFQSSSEKYTESIKRRKLGYYSQPLFSHAQIINEEVKDSCKTNSEFSSGSLSQENSSSEVFDDNVQYYENKFKDLFKDDGNKYLRNNLKPKKHLSL